MDITIVTTARTNDEGYALLELLGFPFRDRASAGQEAS
jgi:large subunit ribosomal protein L5